LKKLTPWFFSLALFGLIMFALIEYEKEQQRQADEQKQPPKGWHYLEEKAN